MDICIIQVPYNPALDRDDRTLRAGLRVIGGLAACTEAPLPRTRRQGDACVRSPFAQLFRPTYPPSSTSMEPVAPASIL